MGSALAQKGAKKCYGKTSSLWRLTCISSFQLFFFFPLVSNWMWTLCPGSQPSDQCSPCRKQKQYMFSLPPLTIPASSLVYKLLLREFIYICNLCEVFTILWHFFIYIYAYYTFIILKLFLTILKCAYRYCFPPPVSIILIATYIPQHPYLHCFLSLKIHKTKLCNKLLFCNSLFE